MRPYAQPLLAFLEYSPMRGQFAENALIVISLALLCRLHLGRFRLHTVGVEPLGALMHDAPVHAGVYGAWRYTDARHRGG